MPDKIQFNPVRILDPNGDPAAGAMAYFYVSGTSTPLTVYTSETMTVAHPTPVVADAQGVFPAVYAAGPVKVNVTSGTGASMSGFPIDPASHSSAGTFGAASVPFMPVEGNGAKNVQEAIEVNTAATEESAKSARLLTAGTGLTGGGDLSGDIAFAVDIATAAEVTDGDEGKMVDAKELKANLDPRFAAVAMAELAEWTHSADVTEIVFDGLADWDVIDISGILWVSDTSTARVQVSANDGTTWLTAGYDSTALQDATAGRVTDGFKVSVGSFDAYLSFTARINNMNKAGRKTQFASQTDASINTRMNVASGRYNTSQAHNAIRVTGATFKGGFIRAIGVMK